MLLGLAILGAACTKDDSGGATPDGVAPPSSETPAFDFTVDRITSYTAAPGKLPKGVPPEVKKASDDIAAQMSIMYKAAYLDPENWRNGTYDAFFHHFDQKAGSEAKTQVDYLTAGTAAGDQYSDIQPGFAHLNTKVMLDAKGKPLLAVAVIDFNATATTTSGEDKNLRSQGQYFLEPDADGWKVLAYHVNRQDGGPIPVIPSPGAQPEKPKNEKKDQKNQGKVAA